MKRWWYRLIVPCVCLLLLFGGRVPRTRAKREEVKTERLWQSRGGQELLEVTFFNVGKGDAIFIESGGETMLIDTGFDDTSELLLGELEKRNVSSLTYLVITHFDQDHVGGADKVLAALNVDRVIQPDYKPKSKKQYKEYKEALKERGLEAWHIKRTTALKMGEAELLFYPPQQEAYEEADNDQSLVISLTYGAKSFLFTGDSESARLRELLEQPEFALEHSVLKVPHHGLFSRNSREFLERVSPEAAVITCRDEWKTLSVQRTLRSEGSRIYMTSRGIITCTTDGRTLFVEQ